MSSMNEEWKFGGPSLHSKFVWFSWLSFFNRFCTVLAMRLAVLSQK
jgi:hypothetical protein